MWRFYCDTLHQLLIFLVWICCYLQAGSCAYRLSKKYLCDRYLIRYWSNHEKLLKYTNFNLLIFSFRRTNTKANIHKACIVWCNTKLIIFNSLWGEKMYSKILLSQKSTISLQSWLIFVKTVIYLLFNATINDISPFIFRKGNKLN